MGDCRVCLVVACFCVATFSFAQKTTRMAKRRRQKNLPEITTPFTDAKGAFLLAAAAVLVYANALGNGLVYDDHFLIERNTLIREFDLWGVFTTHYWGGYEGNETGQYRPITILSLALDGLGGISPFRFHLTNILLHAFNSALAFLIGRRAGLALPGALFAGLLFALHPIHAEVAAGVTFGRADLLAAWFVLGCLLAYIVGQKQNSGRWYAIALMAFFLGLLSKESALTAIGPLVAYDLYKGLTWSQTIRERWRYWGGFIGVFGSYLFVRWAAADLGLEAGSLSELNNPLLGHAMDVRIYTAAALFWKYIALIAWPAALSVDYSYNAIPVLQTPWHPSVLLGLATSLAGVFLWIWSGWRRTVVFFFGSLFWAPYAAISQSVILINALFLERFMYVPVLGLFLVAAYFFEYHWHRNRQAAWLVAVLVLGGCAGRTWYRNADWKSDFSLYLSAVSTYPDSAKMQHALADELAQRRQFDAAESAYRRALDIREDALTWNNLGNLFAATNRFEAAAGAYEKAVGLKEDYGEAWMNWGLTAMRAEKAEAAEKAFEKAARLSPGDADAHYSWGIACEAQGQMQKAARAYRKAVSLRPDWAEAQFNLANACRSLGDKDAAIAAYRHFLSLWRGDPQVARLAQEHIRNLEP